MLLIAAASPLHEDEARYGVWALSLLRGDPWLLHTPIDKPPLAFYPMALSLALFGPRDVALRLPGVLWTLLMLGVLARLAQREGIGGGRAIVLALLSPLLWASGPTALTDPPMVALALLAVERARANRTGQAGLAWALAFLCKPTALMLLPLVIASVWPLDGAKRSALARGAAAPLLLLWLWEGLRDGASLWLLGSSAYGTLGIPSTAVLSWLRLLLITLGPIAVVLIAARFPRRFTPSLHHPLPSSPHPLIPSSPHPLITSSSLLLWLPIHLLLGFQPWERYLLPLVPLGAWLGAALLPRVPLRPAVRAIALALLLIAPLAPRPLLLAPHDGRWTGIEQIGVWARALPSGATLYFRDSGDPLRWYAQGTAADLRWVGLRWTPRLAPSDGPVYLVARDDDRLPAPLAVWPIVLRVGHFEVRRSP